MMLMWTSVFVSLLELVAELVDLGAALADDDPRARGLDVDLQLVGEALDVDLGDAGVREALLQLPAELQVLVEVVSGSPASAYQRECQVRLKPSRNPYG